MFQRKTIFDLRKGGMKENWIVDIFKMKYRTIYSIIQRQKLLKPKKSRGRNAKLWIYSPRRLLRCIDYSHFKHIAVITAEHNSYNGL